MPAYCLTLRFLLSSLTFQNPPASQNSDTQDEEAKNPAFSHQSYAVCEIGRIWSVKDKSQTLLVDYVLCQHLVLVPRL